MDTFKIVESKYDDPSTIELHPEMLDKLGMFRGDLVTIYTTNKDTICIVLSNDALSLDTVAVNSTTRNNLGSQLGDSVSIRPAEVPYGTRVQILPFNDTLNGFTGNIFEELLQPFFENAYRPIKKYDKFKIQSYEFMVTEIEGSDCCIVSPNTIIHCEGELHR